MPSATLYQSADPSVHELRHIDEAVQDRLREVATPAMPLQRLKRTGRRPHLFNGVTVATVCGVTPALPFWYELNAHRTITGGYVSDIRLFRKSPDLPDLFWVEEHGGLDELVAFFERYEPVGDVVPPPAFSRPLAPAELALATARLQLEIDQITQHYRALVGELLAAITPKA